MIIMSFGQLWLLLAHLAALPLCWTKRAHSDWSDVVHIGWTGLMLRAAVTAVRGVSLKPIRRYLGSMLL